jgi:NTE family protein
MADPSFSNKQGYDKPYVVLALQGGGAMGAFQFGVYQALSEKGYEPDWVAGISIGAINGSIIAGNRQEHRLKRLAEFWTTVAGDLDWWDYFPNYAEKLTNLWKVWQSMVGGVPGFFHPNPMPPLFAPPSSSLAGSLYNTQRLKKTLQRLIDFPLLNDQQSPAQVRLSLGATDVRQGEPRIFESFGSDAIKITVDHVMASGALAPSFPGVRIDGRLYWDGGISSNSSIRNILHHLNKNAQDRNVLVFAIDLWSHGNREPKGFDEVCWRLKQINYSSRLKDEIERGKLFLEHERQKERGAPGGAKSKGHIALVRVSYRSEASAIPWDDALFSRPAIERRIQEGYSAMLEHLQKAPKPWEPLGRAEAVTTHSC